VGIGAVVGRLGSTGRSTGPHVHYEVWYDDKVRNPSNFIEAGHHVL
jgi:murein DD-endopeptidase MepM/ murein hydrolase activator NlpD